MASKERVAVLSRLRSSCARNPSRRLVFSVPTASSVGPADKNAAADSSDGYILALLTATRPASARKASTSAYDPLRESRRGLFLKASYLYRF